MDFSDRTIAEYFEDEFGIDFDDQRYSANGTSKRNRLTTFFHLEDACTSAKVLRALPHVSTPKEEAQQEKYEQYLKRKSRRSNYDRWGWGDYESQPVIPEFDYIPNGQLAFRFTTGSYGLRRTFGDGKTQTIEKLLPTIMAGARSIAEQKKKDREERRIQKLKWEEESKIAAEKRRIANLEKRRAEAMDELMGKWRRAAEVREFVNAVRIRTEKSDAPDIAEDWLAWASGYADHLDPLTERVPRLAKMEDFSSWELDRY